MKKLFTVDCGLCIWIYYSIQAISNEDVIELNVLIWGSICGVMYVSDIFFRKDFQTYICGPLNHDAATPSERFLVHSKYFCIFPMTIQTYIKKFSLFYNS